jgi:putative ABC transport system permease protein
MFRNFIMIALRTFNRERFFAFINVLGLSIGIAGAFLIFLFLKSELSNDRNYDNHERIYRLAITYNSGGKVNKYCNVGRPIGPTMLQEYSDIIASTRMAGVNRLDNHSTEFTKEKQKYPSYKAFYADSLFFRVFSNEFISGDPDKALKEPFSVVLTESLAKKIFGEEEAYGKTVEFEESGANITVTVTGVIRDYKGRTHMPYEALISWRSRPNWDAFDQNWFGSHVYTYVLLSEKHDTDSFLAKFPDFFEQHMKSTFESLNTTAELHLQSLTSIYLNSDLIWEAYPNGNVTTVYIFSAIAVFLILIAAINYVNLSTARSVRRNQEVAIRKVFGSPKKILIRQFLGESIFMALLACITAIILVELLMPVFNNLSGTDLMSDIEYYPIYIAGLVIFSALVGLLAGIYPAFYTASFSPIKVLRSKSSSRSGSPNLRRVLIVLQFSISIAMLTSTFIVMRQLNYVMTRDIGLNKENLMVVHLQDTSMLSHVEAIREDLLSLTGIKGVGGSPNIPGLDLNQTIIGALNDSGGIDQIGSQFMFGDYDFIPVMEMEIIDGRAFSREYPSDFQNSVIINQTAARMLGWLDESAGKQLAWGEDTLGNPRLLNVIGVLKDFHLNSLQYKVHPVIMVGVETGFRGRFNLYIRYEEGQEQNVVARIQNVYNSYSNGNFQYFYLEDKLGSLYQDDEKLFRLFLWFSFITIFLACLGVLGLISFSTLQKSQEISIRKVLGSGISRILLGISREFLILVLASNLIGWPSAFFLMKVWLNNFAYSIKPGIWEFILSGIIAFLISMITISVLAFRTAKMNPADVLRSE